MPKPPLTPPLTPPLLTPPSPTPPLARQAGATLTEQLALRFAERIRNRLLPPGARLPSVRECARRHAISASTVVAAYDQLLAQGLIEARQKRGFFVRDGVRDGVRDLGRERPPEPAVSPTSPTRAPAERGQTVVDATTLMRGMFHQMGDKPMPGSGVLPAEWMETTFLGPALRRVSAGPALNALSLKYGEPAGDAVLRHALARKLNLLEIHAGPDQIVTTVGATQALDVVSRALLRHGDAVLVEEPGWAIEFARLTQLGMQILPVPRHAEGPDLAVIERYCQTHQPKLMVCVSVLHNPTGYSISPAVAHRLLQLAQRHGFRIVEDDTYAHLAPGPATRLSALDQLEHTIYISGFSKILAPNWRIGFLAASPALIDRLVDVKLLSTLTTSALLEQAVAYCLEQGAVRRHAVRVRQRLDAARARSVKLALHAGCRFVAPPSGLFGWVDTGVDTDRLAQVLLDAGYLIAPGALFHAGRRPTTLMRINFATTQDAAFWKAFEQARRTLDRNV